MTTERTTMEVTSPAPYTCKHGCERDLLMQAFADEANLRITAAQTEAANLRLAVAPVLDWYQSDEHHERSLDEIVADIVSDLQHDRPLALSAAAKDARVAELEAEVARLREALKPFARIADMDEHKPDGAGTTINVNLCRNARAALGSPT